MEHTASPRPHGGLRLLSITQKFWKEDPLPCLVWASRNHTGANECKNIYMLKYMCIKTNY